MSVKLYWIPGTSSNSGIGIASTVNQPISIMPYGFTQDPSSSSPSTEALSNVLKSVKMDNVDEIWIRMPSTASYSPFSKSSTTMADAISEWNSIVQKATGKKITGVLSAHEDHAYYPIYPPHTLMPPDENQVAADAKAAGVQTAIIGGGTGGPSDLYFVENYEPSCEGRFHPGVYAYSTTHLASPVVSAAATAMATQIGGKPRAAFMCPGCACSGNSYKGTCEEGGTPIPFPTSLGSLHHHHKKHNHKTWTPLHFDTMTTPTQASLSGEALAAYHKLYPSCTGNLPCQLIPTLGVTGSNADCLVNLTDVNATIEAYKAAGGTALGLYYSPIKL